MEATNWLRDLWYKYGSAAITKLRISSELWDALVMEYRNNPNEAWTQQWQHCKAINFIQMSMLPVLHAQLIHPNRSWGVTFITGGLEIKEPYDEPVEVEDVID